jgi:hypothetical protein
MKAFRESYQKLEARMKDQAEADGHVYLPNPEPSGQVEYIFVCMEPSLGGWARTPEAARAKVEAGYRNFCTSIGDFILHFCIREYLCERSERYHITDLSKGVMPVKQAAVERQARYFRWSGLLEDEMNLVAKPGASIFAVGKTVEEQLDRQGFPRDRQQFPTPVTKMLHYSGRWPQHRANRIVGHEKAFERFKGSVSLERLRETAEEVLNKSVPATFRDEILQKREMRKPLSESDEQLIFIYKCAFEDQKRGQR